MASSDTSGFNLYALDHPHSVRTIRQKLREIRDERLQYLASASDWGDYRHRVGLLEGIDEALRVCDDVERAERA